MYYNAFQDQKGKERWSGFGRDIWKEHQDMKREPRLPHAARFFAFLNALSMLTWLLSLLFERAFFGLSSFPSFVSALWD